MKKRGTRVIGEMRQSINDLQTRSNQLSRQVALITHTLSRNMGPQIVQEHKDKKNGKTQFPMLTPVEPAYSHKQQHESQ